MKTLYKWKVSWVLLLLMAAALIFSPTYLLAAESIKLNSADRLSENFSKVTYVDDDDWADTDCHILVGGLFGPNTITSGDVGPIKLAADGAVQVDVESMIPGTGATSLGKAIDSVIGATDTGIMMLGRHQNDSTHLVTADGDYDVPHISDYGALLTSPEQHHTFDAMNATAGWTVLGNDTLNLATTLKHVLGTNALTFDKADGDANTVFAAIQKTLTSVDLGGISPHDLIQTVVYIPDLTNVSYVFARLGTSSSHYNEWRIPVESLTAATFEVLLFNIGDASYAGITGNGWTPSAITYVCIGVAFDLETRDLAGIVFDEISFHTNQHTSAELNAEVTSSVSSANVTLKKVGSKNVTTGAGDVGTGSTSTQRVTIADNDTNLSLMSHSGKTLIFYQIDTAAMTGGTDVELIADPGSTTIYVVEMALTVDAQCTIQFTDGAETQTTAAPEFYFAQRGGIYLPRGPGYRFSSDASEALAIDDAAAGTVNASGYIWYYVE